MRIGIDFDGVVTDCTDLKSAVAKEMYGVDIPPTRFKKELVIPVGLLTAEQYRTVQAKIYHTMETGLRMQEVPGALEYIERLRSHGHSPEIVSSRAQTAMEVAQEWLSRRRMQIPFVGVGYGVEKTVACQGMYAYIDDDLDKLVPLTNVPHRFLFHWGSNAHLDERGIATRVDSWKTFYAYIQKLVPQ